jgi:exopolysaccharide biosynthesis predicted pyruvyltransferase EpsI
MFHRYKNRCQTVYYQERLKRVRRIAESNLPLIEQDAPLLSFESFVECVQRAGQVHTDRLHCMILSVLLGKDVFAYPTAYGKLEAVYEHSIKSWAKVYFVGA